MAHGCVQQTDTDHTARGWRGFGWERGKLGWEGEGGYGWRGKGSGVGHGAQRLRQGMVDCSKEAGNRTLGAGVGGTGWCLKRSSGWNGGRGLVDADREMRLGRW